MDMQNRNYLQQSDTDLRGRLQQLLASYSPAEIARRTGISLVNVTRYLKGTRIPAGFCSALVNSLGVNPSWLLSGEGSPFVADITTGTVRMAGDVLKLVEAMNSVAQMRLGALTGKHHLRVLRELNSALTSYEDLRVRLNRHSAPIFERLLDDIEKALTEQQLERALELRKAALQVERLCDEPELSRRFVKIQAHLALLDHDAHAAMRFQQKLVREPLTEGRLASGEECEDFLRLALGLQHVGRTDDALRLCEAFVALAGRQGPDWPVYADIRFLEGSLLARLGRMREGMALMLYWQPRTTGRRVATTRPLLTRHMVTAGLKPPREALEDFADNEAMLGYLAELGGWIEDAAFLDDVLRVLDSGTFRVVTLSALQLETARRMADALQGRGSRLAAGLRDMVGKREPASLNQPGVIDGYCAQIALAVGDKKGAAKYQARAREYHARPDIRENIDVLQRGIFLRNEIRLDPESKEAADAREEIEKHVENGYWLLRSALAE